MRVKVIHIIIPTDKTSSSVTSGSGGGGASSGGGGGASGGGGGGADWLGLGGDDTGLELDLPTYKPPTPSRRVGQRTEPERTGKHPFSFLFIRFPLFIVVIIPTVVIVILVIV